MSVAMILSTILFVLVNCYLFMVYFKEKKISDDVERLAVMFGANMSVLFVDAFLLFFGALAEDGLLFFLFL